MKAWQNCHQRNKRASGMQHIFKNIFLFLTGENHLRFILHCYLCVNFLYRFRALPIITSLQEYYFFLFYKRKQPNNHTSLLPLCKLSAHLQGEEVVLQQDSHLQNWYCCYPVWWNNNNTRSWVNQRHVSQWILHTVIT